MAARELSRNFATRYCLFYIDSFDNDAKNLPTNAESGKEELSLSSPCSFGSIAKDANGQKYVLTGDNEWALFNSGSGSGGGSGGIPELDIATDKEVNDMLDDVFA